MIYGSGTPRISGLKWLFSACAKPRSIDRSHSPTLKLSDVCRRQTKCPKKINTAHTIFHQQPICKKNMCIWNAENGTQRSCAINRLWLTLGRSFWNDGGMRLQRVIVENCLIRSRVDGCGHVFGRSLLVGLLSALKNDAVPTRPLADGCDPDRHAHAKSR